jgi:hypothetical protein
VRIECCGANLCGYAENSGEKILINMKPSDNKRGGRLHDPEAGSNCDATIAMKGPSPLKMQGLRVRRPVLRRPDPDARRLNPSAQGIARHTRPFASCAFFHRASVPRDGTATPVDKIHFHSSRQMTANRAALS